MTARSRRNLSAVAVVSLALFVLIGCSETEEVTIKASDVQYGDTPGKTVKEEIDDVKKSSAGKSHTHAASEITGFDGAARTAMGKKATTNPLNHERYTESDLAASATIKVLKAEIAALKTQIPSGTCPAGYTQDTTFTSYTLCKKGNDEVVRVGDFWIDRFEIHIVNAPLWNSGKCDGTGGQCYGCLGTFQDNYPASFPDSGNWTAPLYASSMDTSGSTKKHYPPSRGMTWFQAQQA